MSTHVASAWPERQLVFRFLYRFVPLSHLPKPTVLEPTTDAATGTITKVYQSVHEQKHSPQGKFHIFLSRSATIHSYLDHARVSRWTRLTSY